MIHHLRRRHRIWWSFLGFTLPLLILAGFVAARNHGTPPSPVFSPMGVTRAKVQLEAQTPHGPTTVEVTAIKSDGKLFIHLDPAEPLKKPDVLVYWQTGETTRLEDAWLLGNLGGGPRAFSLPQDQTRGQITLFSLAHGEVLGQTPLALTGDEP